VCASVQGSACITGSRMVNHNSLAVWSLVHHTTEPSVVLRQQRAEFRWQEPFLPLTLCFFCAPAPTWLHHQAQQLP